MQACYFGPLVKRSSGANRGTDYRAGIADRRHITVRCGSPYSIIVAWMNAAVRSDSACKRGGTGLAEAYTTDDAMARLCEAGSG